jgi:ubiquinone biosynthesis protein UbiJ
MSVQVIDRELERLEGLWADGLSDAYRSYLDAVAAYEADAQPKLALAAALIEVGIRLQGLGGTAAPPPALLMGDLCLARASRLLADAASQDVQVAFAEAIEEMAADAASGSAGRSVRELLLQAFEPVQ